MKILCCKTSQKCRLMLAALFSENKWDVMLVMTDYAKTYASTIYQSLRAAVHMRTITVMQIKLVVVVVVA